MSEKPKSTAQVLKEALAAKKNAQAGSRQALRPDKGQSRIQKDAERRAGKSRKVH
jgi:hypothetical protein